MTQPLLGYRVARLEPGGAPDEGLPRRPVPDLLPSRAGSSPRQDTLAVVFQLNDLVRRARRRRRDHGSSSSRTASPSGRSAGNVRRTIPTCPSSSKRSRSPTSRRPTTRSASRSAERRHGDRVRFRGVRPELRRGRAPALVLLAHPARTRRSLLRRRSSGSQLFNLGRYDEARVVPRTGLEPASRLPRILAGALARVQLALDDPAAAAKTLEPFRRSRADRRRTRSCVLAAEALMRVGRARAGGRAPGAGPWPRSASTPSLMNALGECYLRPGESRRRRWRPSRNRSSSARTSPRCGPEVEALRKKDPA
ncbi:MAG: hypothetical protein MZV63_65590 [Marinilabiliales bacterium]|nr:hypothetical protein [Marinilabiliales bacterium]